MKHKQKLQCKHNKTEQKKAFETKWRIKCDKGGKKEKSCCHYMYSKNFYSFYFLTVQRIPIWWRWYYWANPVAWSLYGLVASQYADSEKLVKLSDGVQSLSTRLLVKNVFGFRHDFIGIAGVMVVGFCLLFAVIFAFAIKTFNFQRRWFVRDWMIIISSSSSHGKTVNFV